ncbi:MAG: HlyD family efflux transporter periplasmic adaptor subunit [Bacteroidota bacterium]
MEEHEKIELRSDEVQEILGTPPRWIVRWGTTFVVIGVLLLGYFSYLIKYPDVVTVPMTITTSIEPVAVVAEKSGHLARVFVDENSVVGYGEIMGVIQNQADLEDVLLLDSLAVEMQLFDIQDFLDFEPPGGLQLGGLQINYSRFVQLFKDFTNIVSSRYDIQRKDKLDLEIRSINSSIRELEKKLQKAGNEYRIRDNQVRVIQQLFSDGTESRSTLEDAVARRAVVDRQMQEIRTEISDKRVSISRIESQKTNISLDWDENQKNKFVELQQHINKMKAEVDKWKRENLLIAPMEGTVSLVADYRSEKQFVNEGSIVMSVIPIDGDELIGKSFLPTRGLGKVEIGNKVIIRVEGYPYEEYGVVRGVLESKGRIPNEAREYPIRVELPDGLLTSFNEELNFDQKMTGIAEIISEDRRFIQRIFDQFYALFNKY